MILESVVETTLKTRLNDYGFLVYKLYTPGHTGVMDRMIIRPRYSPGPPMFVEVKRPGKKLRPLQQAVGEDWMRRGCRVLKPCTTLGEVEQLCHDLIQEVMPDYMLARDEEL
jgi:hypothetical protein